MSVMRVCGVYTCMNGRQTGTQAIEPPQMPLPSPMGLWTIEPPQMPLAVVGEEIRQQQAHISRFSGVSTVTRYGFQQPKQFIFPSTNSRLFRGKQIMGIHAEVFFCAGERT